MALPNLTPATAIELVLPANISQNVRDAGTTFSVYYKHTATQNGFLGFWAFGDLVTYQPSITVDDGINQIITVAPTNTNRPVQFPVLAGRTYTIRVITNSSAASPAVLLITASLLTQVAGAVGDILVNDDFANNPAIIVSPVTSYLVKRAVNQIQAGEEGDVLLTGHISLANRNINFPSIKFYDKNFRLLKTVEIGTAGLSSAAIPMRANRATGKYWVAIQTNPVELRSYDASGNLLSSQIMTGVTLTGAISVSTDDTILYYRNTTSTAILKWNIVTNTGIGTLSAASVGIDILTLSDGTVLTINRTSSILTQVFRYSAAGALLNTYNLNVTTSSVSPRLAMAIDNPNSFWVWVHLSTQDSQFINIKASDGSILQTTNHALFESKTYSGVATATPPALFGISNSCPFIILTQNATFSPRGGGLYTMDPGSEKSSDSQYDGAGGMEEVAIPNPFGETYLVGDQ